MTISPLLLHVRWLTFIKDVCVCVAMCTYIDPDRRNVAARTAAAAVKMLKKKRNLQSAKMHARTYTHIHTCETRMHTCSLHIDTHTHPRVHTRTHEHAHLDSETCAYVRENQCMCVHVYVKWPFIYIKGQIGLV